MTRAGRLMSLTVALVALAAPAAMADVVATGPPITVAPAGDAAHPRGYPDVAMAADGTTAVVWTNSDDFGRYDTQRVWLRRFDRHGAPLGTPVQIGPDAPTSIPAIAMAPDGRFVVAYDREVSHYPDTWRWRIEVQRFAADGAPVGAPLLPGGADGTDSDALPPGLTMAADGRFAVAWVSDVVVHGDQYWLQARMYGADGTPVADPATFARAPSWKEHPSPVYEPDGGLLLTWAPWAVSGVPIVVPGRRIGPDGALDGGQLTLWTDPPIINADHPVLAANADGKTFLAFTADGHDTGVYVIGRALGADGGLLGPAAPVAGTGWYSAPDAVLDRDGNVLLAYEDEDRALLTELHADGSAAGAPLPVAQGPHAALRPVVATDGTARAVVADAEPGSGGQTTMKLRRFTFAPVTDEDGAAQPPPVVVPDAHPPAAGGTPVQATGPTDTAPTTAPPPARRCTSRRRITLRIPRGAVVRVDGRRVHLRTGARTVVIDLRGRPAQVVTVTVVVHRRVVQTRRFRTCAPPRYTLRPSARR